MNTSGEAAEQVVRIMLEGSEVLLRLTGSGAKNVAALLASVFKQQKRTRGSIRMTNMLRSGKPLKVVTLQRKDLPKFRKTAGQYGIMYTVLKTRNDKDGIFDVMIRADDESKMARLMERYKMVAVDTAAIRSEIVKAKEAPDSAQNEKSDEKEEPVAKPEPVVPADDQLNLPEPDIGDLNERKKDGRLSLSKSELQKIKDKDGIENGNPTAAKADQDLSLGKGERPAEGSPSRDSGSKELISVNPTEKKNGDLQSDESPFWPSSQKKKEKGNRISILREIRQKRTERAERQKELLQKEQIPIKTNHAEKEGR